MDATYFHGGVPGLAIGDLLTPGRERERAGPLDTPSNRPDRIYVTTDRDYAQLYASLWGRGDLYLVEPAADLAPASEDFDTFPSFVASSARVAAVLRRGVALSRGEFRRLFLRVCRCQGVPKADAEWFWAQMVAVEDGRTNMSVDQFLQMFAEA